MGRVSVFPEVMYRNNQSPPSVQRPVHLVRDTWHAVWPAGAPVNAVAGFTNPSAEYCDRIPELALAVGGTPGTYAITGTWDGAAQSASIATVANSTVKANVPFDTVTSVVGPDPGANLTLYHGDLYADPPARTLWTGGGGDLRAQLSGNATMPTFAITLAANLDFPRSIVRINRDDTTLTDALLCW